MTDTLAAMPKTELHLHLEGTISAETLWAMAARNQVALPVGSLAELRALYRFESFDTFLHLWLAMCRCLRREADYEQVRGRGHAAPAGRAEGRSLGLSAPPGA